MMKFYVLKMCGLIDRGYRKEPQLLVWRIPMGCDDGIMDGASDIVSPG
ncbi:hypothetical protein FVEG_11191 [Fusarium verticillioides 7600]|uniref:Uncharacterized protein n=1 Tax=Gibberella moniliformis (strain M3125 / FGSC 7600) TaxID=334819 RepID=W7MLT9_GIBM7|nr:hypothetical protein FVEG_11191 [Fusarium verticillioides 7600]EWG52443.1 hypothetical protein FVEG_11191 [Fusarium verticillioides 7600]